MDVPQKSTTNVPAFPSNISHCLLLRSCHSVRCLFRVPTLWYLLFCTKCFQKIRGVQQPRCRMRWNGMWYTCGTFPGICGTRFFVYHITRNFNVSVVSWKRLTRLDVISEYGWPCLWKWLTLSLEVVDFRGLSLAWAKVLKIFMPRCLRPPFSSRKRLVNQV